LHCLLSRLTKTRDTQYGQKQRTNHTGELITTLPR
jgi:hypothetical protein